MQCNIQCKTLSQERTWQPFTYDLPETPHTVEQLLTMIAQIDVASQQPQSVLTFMTDEVPNYDEKLLTTAERPDVHYPHAIDAIMEAFEAGHFKIAQQHVYTSIEDTILWQDAPWTILKVNCLNNE